MTVETVKKSDEMLLEEAQKIFPFKVTLLSEIVDMLDTQTKQFVNDSIERGANPPTILLDLKETTDSFEENKRKLSSFVLSVPESYVVVIQLKTNDKEREELVVLNISGVITGEESTHDEYTKIYWNKAFFNMVDAIVGQHYERVKPIVNQIISDYGYMLDEITNLPSHTLDYGLMELQIGEKIKSLHRENLITADFKLTESDIDAIEYYLRIFAVMYKDEVMRERSLKIAIEFHQLRNADPENLFSDEELFNKAEENIHDRLRVSLDSQEKDDLFERLKEIIQ